MFCSKCGKTLEENTKFCASCGTEVSETSSHQTTSDTSDTPKRHDVPKCTYCGHIEEWKVGPLLRPIDIAIGIILLLFGFVPGVVYLGVVAIIRSNNDNREKICKKCGAKNMFTNMY